MSQAWPKPKGGWVDVQTIGDPMTDEEIRAAGWKPTKDGWQKQRNPAAIRGSVRNPTAKRQPVRNPVTSRGSVPAPRQPRAKRTPRKPRT